MSNTLKKLTWNIQKSNIQNTSVEQKRFIQSKKNKVLLVATAGSGKCIVNSLVSTRYGLQYIKDFEKYTQDTKCIYDIPTFDIETGELKKKQTSNWFCLGKQPTIKVTTKNGYTIEGTYEHPILILNTSGDLEFRRLDSIKKQDVVAISKIGFFSKEDKCSIKEARLLGYLIADGYLPNKGNSISFSNSVQSVITDYMNCIESINSKLVSKVIHYKSKKSKTVDHTVTDGNFKDYLKSLGLKFEKANKKSIPWTVLQSSKKVIKSFLQSYIDCEGYASNNSIEFITASKQLSIELQTLFLQFGIRVSRLLKWNSKYKRNYYRLTIYGNSLEIFLKEIGFRTNVRYNNKIKKIIDSRNRNTNVDVIPNIYKKLIYFKDTYFLGKSFYNGHTQALHGIGAFSDYLQNNRNPSFVKVKDILKYVPKNDKNYYKLQNYCNNFFFDFIADIKYKNNTVYDFTVPTTHCFVSNGFINHNTRSLTSRVINLINNKDVDPSRILLITFTIKAGEEMQTRISNKIGDEISRYITCGTFHSFAVKMLRRFTPHGIPKNFSILDSSDAFDTWNKCAELGNCTIQHTKKLFGVYSMMRNKMMSMADIVDEKWPDLKVKQRYVLLNSFKKNIEIYTKYKKKYFMYDFDDLLEIVENLLRDDKNFRKRVAELFDYILIDEIQDCNAQQLNIIKYISTERPEISIYGVGDPTQSIYKFRGADHHLMESFPEEFGASVLSLVTNYRSTQQILDVANAVGNNFTSVRWKNKMIGTYDGEKPYYVRTQDEEIQAEFVAEHISKWIKNKVPGNEIAVLYRSNNFSIPIEMALAKKGVLFEKRGGQSLLEMAHIKDILSFFKAAYYASDVIAWTRMFSLHKGIGTKTAQKMYNSVFKSDNGIGYLKTCDPVFQDIGQVLQKLLKYNKDVDKANEIVYNYVEPILSTKYGESWKKRSDSIRVFFNLTSKMSSVKKMLTDIALNTSNQAQDNKQSRKQGGRVILSTVHSFKGLEVNNVFIINCNDGKFPSNWFMYDGKVPFDLKNNPPDPDKLDEERRLFYVACTRARHNLIIVSPMSGQEYTDYMMNLHNDDHSTESIFIKEIEVNKLCNVVMPNKTKTTNKVLKQIYDEFE